MRTGKISYWKKWIWFLIFGISSVMSVLVCVGIGTVEFSLSEVWRGLTVADDSAARLLIWNLRFPRILTGGFVGICLSLSGCILQGVMRNTMASPSTIGVTSGASFVGYLVLVVFPGYTRLLPIGSILGAFATTMLIYEPTTYLDISYQVEVLELVQYLNRRLGITIVMVLHDLNLAAKYSDYLYALKDGEIYARGTAEEILTEENLENIFSIEASVREDENCKRPFFLPIRSLNNITAM